MPFVIGLVLGPLLERHLLLTLQLYDLDRVSIWTRPLALLLLLLIVISLAIPILRRWRGWRSLDRYAR